MNPWVKASLWAIGIGGLLFIVLPMIVVGYVAHDFFSLAHSVVQH